MSAPLPDPEDLHRVGTLARTVGHDFNNILGAVSGYSSMLLDKLAKGDPRHRHAEMIHMASISAGEATERLLRFGRVWTMPPSQMPMPIEPIEDEIIRRLEGGGDRPLAQVQAERSVEPWRVPIDLRYLQYGIEALAANACEAQPSADPPRIDVRFTVVETSALPAPPVAHSPSGKWLQVAISDPGEGMDEETMALAGEPGFSGKTEARRLGLGLPTAQGFAHSHGGMMEVTSAQGEGTTVTIWLPLSPSAEK